MYMPIYTSNGDWNSHVNLVYSQKEVKLSFMENKNDGNLELMVSGAGTGASYYSCIENLDISSFNTSNVTDMSSMFWYCRALTTTINIMSTGVTNYNSMFSGAATNEGACITVNYIADASALVDKMIATKSSTSNVVKGSQI